MGGDVGVGGGERWDKPWVGADEVGDHRDFAIAGVFSAADADGGDVEGCGELGGGGGDDAFENDG